LGDHVTLEVECVDRLFLNLYVPQLQRDLGVVGFFKNHRGMPIVSGALMAPMSQGFVAATVDYAYGRHRRDRAGLGAGAVGVVVAGDDRHLAAP